MSKQGPGGKPKVTKSTVKTAKRLLGYVTSTYKIQFVLVLICILVSSLASISVSLSLKYLLDDFIIPLIGQKEPNFAELYRAITVLAIIFGCGVIATFSYTRLMVVIGQGVLKRVRDEMFEHMQTLPIRYFDQNTNGSIMSLYTNDTDTLRQMINQSIPQVLMSGLMIIVTFIAMIVLSPILTLLAVVVIFLMIIVARVIGGNSGKYFIRQQMDLANAAGGGQIGLAVTAGGMLSPRKTLTALFGLVPTEEGCGGSCPLPHDHTSHRVSGGHVGFQVQSDAPSGHEKIAASSGQEHSIRHTVISGRGDGALRPAGGQVVKTIEPDFIREPGSGGDFLLGQHPVAKGDAAGPHTHLHGGPGEISFFTAGNASAHGVGKFHGADAGLHFCPAQFPGAAHVAGGPFRIIDIGQFSGMDALNGSELPQIQFPEGGVFPGIPRVDEGISF